MTKETTQHPAPIKPKPLKRVSEEVSSSIASSSEEKPNLPASEIKPANKKAAKPKPAKTQVSAKAQQSTVRILPAPKPQAPVAVPVVESIWDTIKERELGLFGLTGQTIAKYCVPVSSDANRCLLKYKVSSVIPALEAAVKDFDFEVITGYLVVSKKA